MSLSPRQLFNEFRPLFRLLDEPFARPLASPNFRSSVPAFHEHFFNDRVDVGRNLPAVDLTEHDDEFIVEAELPGVKKENVSIRVGDGGQSLTIEGKSAIKSSSKAPITQEQEQQAAGEGNSSTAVASSSPSANTESQAVTQTSENRGEVGTPLSSERFFSSFSSFARTIWLPRRVDGNKVKASLTDGVLTLHIPKAIDTESVQVKID